MKQIVCILLSTLLPLFMMGQSASSKEAPEWVKGYFRELDNSSIKVFSAFGYNEEDARNKAIKLVIADKGIGSGTEAKVSIGSGDISVKSSHDLIVKSRIIDEYVEFHPGKGYRVYLLAQTARTPVLPYESVTVTDKYPFSVRAFVPGMAQIYKGSVGKGTAFIVGEVVMLGGVVAFECTRSYYNNRINMTHDSDLRQKYIQNAQLMSGLRNGFIAGAVAVYVWNVIDGAVAKGKRRVFIGEAEAKILPYATPEAAGLTFAMRF